MIFAVGDHVRIVGEYHRAQGRTGIVDKVLRSGSAFVTLDRRPRERTMKRDLVQARDMVPVVDVSGGVLDHDRSASE